eukprot:3620676-Prymnesium_polylepis.2
MEKEKGAPFSKSEKKRVIKELTNKKKVAEKAAAKPAPAKKEEKPKDAGPAFEEEDEDIDPTKARQL